MNEHREMREDESVNAWGVPILRYSEEDVVKQKFIQTIHLSLIHI